MIGALSRAIVFRQPYKVNNELLVSNRVGNFAEIWTTIGNDNHLSLVFNSEEVWNINLDDWNEPHKNKDGTKNKFPKALKDYARKGPIGFQGLHGKAQAPVWYRNIRIKELK